MQSQYDWTLGTYYSLYIYPTDSGIYPPGPNTVTFMKAVNGVRMFQTVYLDPSIMPVNDNVVNVSAIGGTFDVTINGHFVAEFVDPNPLLTGGVALGAMWESTTRYDYVRVDAVPEPSNVLLMGVGLVATAGLALAARASRHSV